ncbi:hypothetical protein Ahy_A06g030897 [Arachis hypogaea]|uniref:Ubiquitin-like domain-containing protein n=1 Tax=Arachis hypogaea TaxID=3818 RepID=A0A445CXS1_ARAHY|nr:hypothetical protein Ahy_A06g030897 [Arachis hypogaea]
MTGPTSGDPSYGPDPTRNNDRLTLHVSDKNSKAFPQPFLSPFTNTRTVTLDLSDKIPRTVASERLLLVASSPVVASSPAFAGKSPGFAGLPLFSVGRSVIISEFLGISEKMIEVVLNDRLGKKVRVKCNDDDTIGDLKKLVAAQTGTRADKIRIQKWYTIYKDHITLKDYEIHDGMGLELYYN